MKKYLFLLLFFLFGIPVCAWIFIPSVANPKENEVPALIYNIMQDKPIRICIDFIETSSKNKDGGNKYSKKYIEPSDIRRNKYYDIMTSVIDASFGKYTDNAKKYIERSGRQEEFADVYKQLHTPKTVYINKGAGAKHCDSYPYDNSAVDLRIVAETNNELIRYQTGRAHAFSGSRSYIELFFHPDWIDNSSFSANKVLVNYANEQKYKTILLEPTLRHEIGHTLGLDDQYVGRSIDDEDKIHTLANILYLPSIPSVMGERDKNNNIRELTCDDAEGIINLLDFYSKEDKTYRKNNGWASLCHKDIIYIEAVPAKVSGTEYLEQLAYAKSNYQTALPAAAQRIKNERKAAADAKEKAEEQERQQHEVRAKIDELKYRHKLDSLGRCAICNEYIDNNSIILHSPKKSIKQNGKTIRVEYPYGKCEIKVHKKCWEDFKAQGNKAPWQKWCNEQKQSVPAQNIGNLTQGLSF